MNSDGIQKVKITATEYFFGPNHIIVKANSPFEISAKKEAGIVPHNITLNAPEADIDFSESLSTEPVTIKFISTKTGGIYLLLQQENALLKKPNEKGLEGIIEVRE